MTDASHRRTMRRSKGHVFTIVQSEALGPAFRAVYMEGRLLGYIRGRDNSWRPVIVGVDRRELLAHTSMVSAARALWWFAKHHPSFRGQAGRIAA